MVQTANVDECHPNQLIFNGGLVDHFELKVLGGELLDVLLSERDLDGEVLAHPVWVTALGHGLRLNVADTTVERRDDLHESTWGLHRIRWVPESHC